MRVCARFMVMLSKGSHPSKDITSFGFQDLFPGGIYDYPSSAFGGGDLENRRVKGTVRLTQLTPGPRQE